MINLDRTISLILVMLCQLLTGESFKEGKIKEIQRNIKKFK